MQPPQEESERVKVVCGFSRAELLRWREFNAMYQFVMRTALCDFGNREPVTVYVFNREQAEYLQSRLGGTIEHLDVGIVDRKATVKNGRKPKYETWDKFDLTEPMKKYMATTICQPLGLAGGSLPAFFDELGRYNLAGLEGKITCPLLSIAGEGEGPMMNGLGHSFYEKLTCPKTERLVRLIEGGEAHCQMNNPSLKHQIEFDWLDDVFKK
jgi:hypothetical protein